MDEMIRALLSNKNMHVGKIIDDEAVTKNALQDAFLELAGGIIKKGGVLSGTYVLLCRQEMYLRLKRELEDLGCVSLDGVRENAVPWFQKDAIAQVICAIISSVEFPAHYIVLTDWSQLQDFLLNGTHPNSGLLAIKGQSREQRDTIVVFTDHVLAQDILRTVGMYEFFDGTYDRVKSVVFHCQYALLQMHNGATKLFGCLDSAIKPSLSDKDVVDVVFDSGRVVSLVPASVDAARKAAITADTLISGKFGA